MTSATFDTHFFVKRLREQGMAEAQAEAIVEIVQYGRDADQASLATKADLTALKAEVQNGFRELELRMTIKLGTMQIASVGVLAAIIKYFVHS